MPRATVESNRVALRVRPADKAVIMRAVALAQTDMTTFILRTALREAQSVIEEHERIKLTQRDSRLVMELLENPPAANAKLRKAARPAGEEMTPLDWREEPISKKHDRSSFDCGDLDLNEFFWRHARQSHDKGAAKTFLAISQADGTTIFGFYSLCPASLAYARTPEFVRKGLARHDVPVFRLGRLAVNRVVQGRGLGGQLILAAGRRCLLAATEVGGVAILIDAKNERAANWYASYGAVPLADAPLSLLLPLATVEHALKTAGKL